MWRGITTNDMNGYIYRYAGIKLAERQLCRSKLCWKIPNHNCTYKDHDLTEEIGSINLLDNNKENNMFTINWTAIKSALISGLLMAVLGVCAYIIQVGDIFNISLKVATNIGVMAFLTSIISVVKNFLTTDGGKFAGLTKIK